MGVLNEGLAGALAPVRRSHRGHSLRHRTAGGALKVFPDPAHYSTPTAALQREAAKKVVEGQLSVRQTEQLVKQLSQEKAPKKEPAADPYKRMD